MTTFKDSPEQAAFRARVRSFIDDECPPVLRNPDPRRLAAHHRDYIDPEISEALRTWRDRRAAQGWIAPSWPKQYGGAGMSPMEQFIFNMEIAEARIPDDVARIVSNGHGGGTILVHGTEEQKAQHLPGILSGEVVWCQLYSEPGAGSDLASLQTRAVLDGDDWVINGQKIWTGYGSFADWGILLARTDPEAPKHRGITFFLLDMKSAGITTIPLTFMGDRESHAQVFFDNVRVSTKNVVGEVNRGWYVSTTTLDIERSSISSAVGTRHRVEALATVARERWKEGLSTRSGARALRLEIADRVIEAAVALMFSFRIADMQNRGIIPNSEASIAKLYTSELNQRIASTELKALGAFGMIGAGRWAPIDGRYAHNYLDAVPATIAGGTSEIQRNIIAQRGLGLPRG